MKKHITLTIALLISYSANAQWQWAKQIGGPNTDGGAILIDANNNIYSIGGFDGTCYFNNDTLYPSGANDMFLAKYDASGNELWAKRIGGNNPVNFNEAITGRVIDNNNSCIYVSGQYYGSMTVDSYTISGTGSLDLFLAKFDLNGNCLWLKGAASSLEDQSGRVSIDPNGNVYWAGNFNWTNGFVDTTPVAKGWFFAKFDSSGNLISVTPYFINEGIIGYFSVSNSEILVSGSSYNDTLVINVNDIVVGSNTIDGFLFKMDLNLNVIWAKKFGGNTSSWDYPTTFDEDANGNIYLAGGFQDSLTIDVTTITNAGKKDMFFAKFDSNGNLVWVRQANATGSFTTIANMIRKDIDGLFYLIGDFCGNATLGTYNISTPYPQDVFVARYDSNGDCSGVRHFGRAYGNSVEIDNTGDVIIAGGFVNTINVGSISLTSHGGGDMFFAKSDAIVGIGGREINPNNQ
ncbi:MAG TPA: hypothetical protein PKL45_15210, partial [Bacteroidia bacterium]|nr:hypothetical protein [Bacteroidia bacterium]